MIRFPVQGLPQPSAASTLDALVIVCCYGPQVAMLLDGLQTLAGTLGQTVKALHYR